MRFENGSSFGFQSPFGPAAPPCDQGPTAVGSIRSYMEQCYMRSQTPTQSYWAESDVDTRYYLGDQSLYNRPIGNAPSFRKQGFNFNLIRPVIQMVSGYQRQHRKSIVITPEDDTDSYACSQLTKLVMWAVNRDRMLETISEAFEGALITGMNLLYMGLDYNTDPINGELYLNRLAYNEYAMDPFWKKPDLSDCGWVWMRKIISDEECRRILPGDVPIVGQGRGYRDGKFQYLPELMVQPQVGQRTVDEFWYQDQRPQQFLIDVRSGDRMPWRGDQNNLDMITQTFAQIDVVEMMVPTVRLCICVDGAQVMDTQNPYGSDSYPFIPVFAYYRPEAAQWPLRVQGITRMVRDPQWIYNRLRLNELDILESQPNSGWIYKENAVVNPQDLFNIGPARLIAVRDEANLGDLQQIQCPRVDASMIQLSDQMKSLIRDISGVNEELLGAAEDDKAGILSMLRQGAGLTTLQTLFDHLDASQKILGQRMIEMIQMNWRPEKIERITNEQIDPKLKTQAFIRYDCVVEEGLNTSTQKQMQFAQLLQLQQMGVPIPPEQLIEASTLQNKHELLESIEIRQQAEQQAMQAQQQAAQQAAMAKAQADQARAMSEMALAQERQTKNKLVPFEALQKVRDSERAEEEGLLDLIKAMKELQQMDFAALRDALTLAQSLKDRNKAEEQMAMAATQPAETDMSAGMQSPAEGNVAVG